VGGQCLAGLFVLLRRVRYNRHIMEELVKLFGSSVRVKLMRLFIFNEEGMFDIDDIVKKSRVKKEDARKEVRLFESIGFIKKKIYYKETISEKTKRVSKKKAQGWSLDPKFSLINPLKSLLIDSDLIRTRDLPGKLKGAGNLKLLVLSGVFMQDSERSIDILIVGDKIDKARMGQSLAALEAEIGKELRYSVFTPEQFNYRINMYDRLILDVFDFPHEVVVNKIGFKK
jgi:hypothetical protein